MDGARDELFARAGLTGDQDRGVARSHLRDHLDNPLHPRAAADQVAIDGKIGLQASAVAVQPRNPSHVLKRDRG